MRISRRQVILQFCYACFIFFPWAYANVTMLSKRYSCIRKRIAEDISVVKFSTTFIGILINLTKFQLLYITTFVFFFVFFNLQILSCWERYLQIWKQNSGHTKRFEKVYFLWFSSIFFQSPSICVILVPFTLIDNLREN